VNYAIIFVSNMERSVAFYRDLVGLPLRFESSHWSEFATEGATLALHASDDPADGKARAALESPGSCRPGLSVSDLDGFHRRMTARGVTCLQEPREVSGSRVAQYEDPDGLSISVGEHSPQPNEVEDW
jgi:lactoylglutathione lyase